MLVDVEVGRGDCWVPEGEAIETGSVGRGNSIGRWVLRGLYGARSG